MKGLTKRQLEILSFIKEYIRVKNYSPSYREIMQHFGFSSLGSVYKHIHVLKRKQALDGESRSSRSLSISEDSSQNLPANIRLPFIGHIVAGTPIELFAQSQTIAVPEFMVPRPKETYVLKAKGDSLHEELIGDSDFLVVEARTEAIAGETVVAVINNHDTIVKRFFREGTYIKLIGSHPHQHPIMLREEDFLIQGIVVAVLRVCQLETMAKVLI